MDESDWLIERFEASRPRLRAVAYRMLGSYTEADDAVQDAWLRLDRADSSGVENLAGWFTSIVARVCLDRLRWRRSRREDPVDAHPSEPMVGVADETTPSTKRSWPTPSVPRCWWCGTCWLPPNGSRSSFTTSSLFPSTKSPRSSNTARTRPDNSPVVPAAASRAPPRSHRRSHSPARGRRQLSCRRGRRRLRRPAGDARPRHHAPSR